jgi:hypothetical protein
LFEEPLHGEGAEMDEPPQLGQGNWPIQMSLDVCANRLQSARIGRTLRLAAFAGLKASGARFSCRTEKPHILPQWPAAGAPRPAKDAGGRYRIEKRRRGIAS